MPLTTSSVMQHGFNTLLVLAMRAESEQQAHDAAIDGPTPPSGGEWTGAGAALAEVAHE